LEDLPYHAILGVAGSWIGFILACLCIVATIYVACADFTVVGFFQETLALPLVALCFIGWKIWKKTKIVSTAEADLVSGRRETDLHAEKEKERAERQNWGMFKRYLIICFH